MNKKSNNGSSGSKMFSQQDKEMGFQLLLSPKASVNVLSPLVAHESTHLYPKLAGSNWTCYITGDVIRLGRTPEHTPSSNSSKIAVDVDFCGNKQVSRRHADIKFNTKKNYWELRVYGRIGVKVNHNLITKKQHPVPLTAMAYLDIGGNGFVFVLPDHTDGLPGKGDTEQTTTAPASTSEKAPPPPTTTRPDATLENEKNDQLITVIVDVLKSLDAKTLDLTTQQIFKGVIQLCRKKSLDSNEYTMDAVLRALVFDSRFKVVKECLDMTAEQSDKVRWCWEQPHFPSQTTTASATSSYDTSNSEAWSYDVMDGSDHPTVETNENLSTTTETLTPIDSGPWPLSNISDATSSRIKPSPSSSSTATMPTAATATPLSVSTPATNIASPALSSGYPAAENETNLPIMTTTPLSQTTSTTVPSIMSSSINRSLGERTLSTFSFTSNMDDGPISLSSQTDPGEAPEPSGRTAWTPLELYHVSAFPDQHAAFPGYSRGLSLFHMYSSIMATPQQHGMNMNETSSSSIPCTLFPRTPGDDDDDLEDFDLTCFNRKRKRKLHSISDHEDRTLWTRFRTTVFRDHP
ncbi:hypothetical protein BCR42DRAFT_400220 [Absidia repens]|uniref:FHA domain-containing protein n=1 Tax=Absidia repens TaxID=90262 RepID=A0A1X2J0Y6_9FUNG|nr:hypothetical protein BCR42DRAFT_400220 [Absidia repens]